MSKYIVSAVAIIAVLGVSTLAPVITSAPTSVSAAQQSTVDPIAIPVNTIIRGSKGSEHELASKTVKNGEYEVKVVSENQRSVHPDSDIYVRSNGDEVVVKDVESKSFVEKTAEGTLNVANGKVTVYLKMGKDKVFSGGVKVVLTYVPPKDVEVCDPETGEIITVKESKQDKYLPVDDPACEDEPEVPEEPEAPEELPKTGAGALLSGLVGSSALGLGVGSWLNSRRTLKETLRK